MHPNYEYFLKHSEGRGRVLDYGCGVGLCVEKVRGHANGLSTS